MDPSREDSVKMQAVKLTLDRVVPASLNIEASLTHKVPGWENVISKDKFGKHLNGREFKLKPKRVNGKSDYVRDGLRLTPEWRELCRKAGIV